MEEKQHQSNTKTKSHNQDVKDEKEEECRQN